jgi:hypothetical protein
MQLFCQSCQAAFASATHCLRCGSRLLSPQESFIHSGKAKAPPPDAIQSTFANRLAVGVLIALGLAFGLREIAATVSLLMDDAFNDLWNHSNSDPATFGIRLFAVLAGALIAGAGRGPAMAVGAAVGLLAGCLFTGFDLYAAGRIQDLLGVFLAGAYPLIGGLAGGAGARLWPADVILPEPARLSSHGSSMLQQLAVEDAVRHEVRPTAWLQIGAGAILAMIGIIASDPIRFGLVKVSFGWLNTGGISKAPVIGLEIGTFTALLGGVIAAIGTGSGARHGFFAAILASAGILIGSTSRANGLFPSVEGFLNLLAIEHDSLTAPRIAINVTLALMLLMSLAGWLGGQLFPPLMPKHLRNRGMQRQS